MLALLLLLAAVLLLVIGAALMYAGARQSSAAEIDWKARITGVSAGEADAGFKPIKGDPLLQWFTNHLQRAGLDVDTRILPKVLSGMAVIALLAGLVAGVPAACVVLIVELIVAYLWLVRRAAKRTARIMEQLPDFVEFMMRALTAGNSLEESLYSSTADADEPIRSVFLSVGRQVRLGAPIEDVLDQAAEIHGITDIRVMAMAARVNRRFGGSLRRIFKSLVQAIRERDAAARELRALTAETRFSAMVLGIVPIALSGYILLQNPDYYLEMWGNGQGRNLLLLSVILQATGVLVIWRMLHAAEERG